MIFAVTHAYTCSTVSFNTRYLLSATINGRNDEQCNHVTQLSTNITASVTVNHSHDKHHKGQSNLIIGSITAN